MKPTNESQTDHQRKPCKPALKADHHARPNEPNRKESDDTAKLIVVVILTWGLAIAIWADIFIVKTL